MNIYLRDIFDYYKLKAFPIAPKEILNKFAAPKGADGTAHDIPTFKEIPHDPHGDEPIGTGDKDFASWGNCWHRRSSIASCSDVSVN